MKKEMVDDIFQYLENITEFQNIIKTGDAKLIMASAEELFNSKEIHHIDSYDEELITNLVESFERLLPVKSLLKVIPSEATLSGEAVQLLEKLITLKTDK